MVTHTKTIWVCRLATAILILSSAPGNAQKRATGGTGPWELKALKQAPKIEITDTQEVQEGSATVTLSKVIYESEPWMGKPTRVFAYYARPAGAAAVNLPAMALVHGGGGKAFPQWARLWAARGYAALAMDLNGVGADGQRLPDGGPPMADEWMFRRLKDGVKNAWSYHAVGAVIRGVSALRAMPGVDKNRVGITGISWGGYLTSIVIGLDDRLKVAVPVYGCGFIHENSAWLGTFAQLPEDERAVWIENFEPSRYLPRCKIPVLWMNGTNDFAYPLNSYQKSYQATRGPRALCITVNMPHGHQAGWARQEIGLFVDSILRPGEFEPGLARVGKPLVVDKTVHVLYESDAPIQTVQIHWTTDLTKPWQQREWQSAKGDANSLTEVQAPLPDARPAVFFVTLTDHRGAVTSTEHVTLPVK